MGFWQTPEGESRHQIQIYSIYLAYSVDKPLLHLPGIQYRYTDIPVSTNDRTTRAARARKILGQTEEEKI
jgi:hypothetical protein